MLSIASLALLAAALATPATPREVTFFVASDTHFGYRGMEEANRRIVEQMNALPGRDYPAAIGGRVGSPRGVLVLGDMTEYSTEEQWRQFEELYGHTGTEGLLRYPVFEALGNHDFMDGSPVVRHIERRHGSLTYSFDWDDLHVVCLGMYPSAARIRWLREDLRKVKKDRPLVVFFHYGMEGPYSDSWESPEERDALAQALKGRRAAVLLHGHWHMAGHYRWRGHEVFRPGSPKHSSHTFLVVRLRAKEIAVGFWNFDTQDWAQTVVRPLP
jgi:predicted phosphodiesterase